MPTKSPKLEMVPEPTKLPWLLMTWLLVMTSLLLMEPPGPFPISPWLVMAPLLLMEPPGPFPIWPWLVMAPLLVMEPPLSFRI